MSEVVVAGGHGKVALRLLRLLAEAGDRGRGLIRNAEHAPDLEAVGAEAVVCDLEQEADLAPVLQGAHAVVFAAGAGAGSGAARKRTMDLGGALKLSDAAKAVGVPRYVMVSAMGAADPSQGSDAMRPYLEAKRDADVALQQSSLDFTIVRPGGLTDDPGKGRVAAAESLGRYGSVTRDDVAAVLLAVLRADNTVGKTFELLEGDVPIEEAVRGL